MHMYVNIQNFINSILNWSIKMEKKNEYCQPSIAHLYIGVNSIDKFLSKLVYTVLRNSLVKKSVE